MVGVMGNVVRRLGMLRLDTWGRPLKVTFKLRPK